MKKIIYIIGFALLFGCGTEKRGAQQSPAEEPQIIQKEEYELIIPANEQQGVLVLMGGNAEQIKKEFRIMGVSLSNGIALMLMNINILLMDESDKKTISTTIINGLKENGLKTENVYLGGLSVGGNMSLLLGDFLIRTNSELKLKGVFIVDSPVDLLGVYGYAKKAITKDLDTQSVAEAEELVELFETQFGQGDSSLSHYEKFSPFVLKTNSIKNLETLNNTKLRFYTEPDTVWWKNNLDTDFENTNAYHIKLLTDRLKKEFGENRVEYIATVNRGYRADGTRHPHSWSIVDENNLANWILNK